MTPSRRLRRALLHHRSELPRGQPLLLLLAGEDAHDDRGEHHQEPADLLGVEPRVLAHRLLDVGPAAAEDVTEQLAAEGAAEQVTEPAAEAGAVGSAAAAEHPAQPTERVRRRGARCRAGAENA